LLAKVHYFLSVPAGTITRGIRLIDVGMPIKNKLCDVRIGIPWVGTILTLLKKQEIGGNRQKQIESMEFILSCDIEHIHEIEPDIKGLKISVS
jgi:hypothetical protein